MGKDWVIAYYDIGKLAYSEPRRLSEKYTFEDLRVEFHALESQVRDGFFCYLVEGTVAPLTIREAHAAEHAWMNRLAREGLDAFKRKRPESKRFPISVVLSVMNNISLVEDGFSAGLDLCEFMMGSGRDIRGRAVRRFCSDELCRQFPGVASINVPGFACGDLEHVRAFMADIEDRYDSDCKVVRVSDERLAEFRASVNIY